MSVRACLLVALLVLLLLLTGCQRLNDERTINVPAGTIHIIEYDAPTYQQKLTIQVSSPGAPVTVYLVRQADREAAETQIGRDKAPAEPLAGKEKAEDISLEATVPAKTAYVLLIRADKQKAEVHVKVNGR